LGAYTFPIRGDGGVEFHKIGERIVGEFLMNVGVVVGLSIEEVIHHFTSSLQAEEEI
jgi:hypothetical protein